ncbi:carbon-nitrogen hydrolase family protein [Microbacterium kribbense]|uniref:Carbon-nitrogen hydrolase family protein n=1 Tax=Microbacterium kribbense TaxID=433645 RepID=A0ABP7GR72_9MICO
MGDSYPVIRLAAIQAASVFLDRQASVARAAELIREAGKAGAEFIVFPEGFIPAHPIWYQYHPAMSPEATGLSVELFANAVEVPGPHLAAIAEAARAAGAFVVVGVCERTPGRTGTLYNTQVYFGPDGEYLGKHQKLVPTVTERLVHGPGSAATFGARPSRYGQVSSLICGENSNPLAVFALIAEGTQVHGMSWPPTFGPTGQPIRARVQNAAIAFAQMAKTFVVAACGVVDEATISALDITDEHAAFLRSPNATGGSVIVSPTAEVMAQASDDGGEQIVLAEADLKTAVRAKFVADVAGHYNRPDVFSLRVDRTDRKLYDVIGDIEHRVHSPERIGDEQEGLDEAGIGISAPPLRGT